MEFKDKDLRFGQNNGDVLVCRLYKKHYFNSIGITLGIYYNGYIYDVLIKEEGMCDHVEDLNITKIVCDYAFTGENVKNIKSPVLSYPYTYRRLYID